MKPVALGWLEAGLQPGQMIGADLAQAVRRIERFMVVHDFVMLAAQEDQVFRSVQATSTGRATAGRRFLFADDMGNLTK